MDPLSVVAVTTAILGSYALLWRLSSQLGLSVIHDGGDQFDIVFVYGAKNQQKHKWLPRNRARWMKDLLRKDFPRARMMAYGYDLDESRIRYFSQMLKIESKRLLTELVQRRRKSQDRPLIFIAHSLGGLLVKNALADAGEDITDGKTTLEQIQLSTKGTLFFGTPLQTEGTESFGAILKRTASEELTLSHQQVSTLDFEAGVVDAQVERYQSIEENVKNFCFWEESRRHPAKVIVSEQHAFPTRGREKWWFGSNNGIKKRHNDLVTFDGPEDEAYIKLRNCLHQSVKPLQPPPQDSSEDWHEPPGKLPEITVEAHFENGADDSIRRGFVTKTTLSDNVQRKSAAIVMLERAVDFSKNMKFAQAESEFSNVLSIPSVAEKENRGTKTTHTLEVLDKMAQHYMRKGDYEKAELLFKRIYVALQKNERSWIQLAAEKIRNAAAACEAQGRMQEAARCLNRARLIYSKINRDDCKAAMREIEARLAHVYDQLGEFEQARKHYASTYDRVKNSQDQTGEEIERALQVSEDYAMSCAVLGDYEKAEELLNDVLTRRWKMLDPTNLRSNDDQSLSATEALERRNAAMTTISMSLNRLRTVYDQQGKSEDAKELQELWTRNLDSMRHSLEPSDKRS